MHEVGSGVRQDIEVFARVPRDCQEAGLARSAPREESAEGWAAGALTGATSVLAGRGELAGIKQESGA